MVGDSLQGCRSTYGPCQFFLDVWRLVSAPRKVGSSLVVSVTGSLLDGHCPSETVCVGAVPRGRSKGQRSQTCLQRDTDSKGPQNALSPAGLPIPIWTRLEMHP